MSEKKFEQGGGMALTLDKFLELVEKSQKVSLKEIGDGRTLVIETKGSTYEITILDAVSGRVRVKGGKYFPEPEECDFQGSSGEGSFLAEDQVVLGLRMEFVRDEERVGSSEKKGVKTSPVRQISLLAPPTQEGVVH